MSSKILLFLQSDSLLTPYGVIIFYSVDLLSSSIFSLLHFMRFFKLMSTNVSIPLSCAACLISRLRTIHLSGLHITPYSQHHDLLFSSALHPEVENIAIDEKQHVHSVITYSNKPFWIITIKITIVTGSYMKLIRRSISRLL